MNILNQKIKGKITLKPNFSSVKMLSLSYLTISSFYDFHDAKNIKTKSSIIDDLMVSIYNSKDLSYAIGTNIVTFKESVDIAEAVIYLTGYETFYFTIKRTKYIKELKELIELAKSYSATNESFDKSKFKYFDAITTLMLCYYEQMYEEKEVLDHFYFNLIRINLKGQDFSEQCMIGSKNIEMFLEYTFKYPRILEIMIRKAMFDDSISNGNYREDECTDDKKTNDEYKPNNSYINVEKNKEFEKNIIDILEEYSSSKYLILSFCNDNY